MGSGHSPTETSQKYRVPFRTVPDPLKNHKATKPAFKVGPSLARKRDDGPILMVFGYTHQLKKALSKLDPL